MLDDADIFESHRTTLWAHAYRMLGDMARAEDVVQEAWIRWQNRQVDVEAPKAFLLKTVTRLCLDELGSARSRHEESRGDRLPDLVDLDESGIGRVERVDRVSMAFLVLLQRLTPAERAVFLLHDVFDMSHAEIAAQLDKTDAACRQLLKRARENVAVEKRVFETSRDEQRRLLMAFVEAVNGRSEEALLALLAEDAVLIADGGPNGVRYGRLRNVTRPVVGRGKIIALMQSFARQDVGPRTVVERLLNGEPAAISYRGDEPEAAIFVSVADGLIRHVFLQIDVARLGRLKPLDS